MAITVDTTTFSSSDASATTLTWSHTCSGSNRLLVVAVPGSRVTAVSGVTYNGVAMTLGVAYNQSGRVTWARIYYLIAPATGANNVVVTYASALTFRQAGAASFNGVDQTAPLGATATGGSASVIGTKSLNITTTKTGSLLIDAMGAAGGIHTPDSGQTVFSITDTNRIAGYEIVTDITTYTQSWNSTENSEYSMAIAEFKAIDLNTTNFFQLF